MIYLNNAGTSWPKPPTVDAAMASFQEMTPDEWLSVFDEGVETTCSFFGIKDTERFLFTTSCTSSLAVAFSDFPWEAGDRLIISEMEHHALSRWFYKLQSERGVEGVIVPRSPDGPVDLEILEKELKKGARMVAMTMASNVTGELLPYRDIIKQCKEYGAYVLLDGAQTAGLIPIDITNLDPDFFVFAGHKGTLGPQGIGGLYISQRISMICPSAACEIVPGQRGMTVFPSYCDAGSAPMMLIAGLTAGIRWLENKGWDHLTAHRQNLVNILRKGLGQIDGIKIVGNNDHERVTGAVSIVTDHVPLHVLKKRLRDDGNVLGSLGFQCAPLAHEALGTSEFGTFRFSVGPMNREEEVRFLLDKLSDHLNGY